MTLTEELAAIEKVLTHEGLTVRQRKILEGRKLKVEREMDYWDREAVREDNNRYHDDI